VRWDDVGTIPFDALGAPGWEPRSRRGAGLSGAGHPAEAADGAADGRARARRQETAHGD
jgi:hypothetical protein